MKQACFLMLLSFTLAAETDGGLARFLENYHLLDRVGVGSAAGLRGQSSCALVQGVYDNGQAERLFMTIAFTGDAARRMSGRGHGIEGNVFWETNYFYPLEVSIFSATRGNSTAFFNDDKDIGGCHTLMFSPKQIQMICNGRRGNVELTCNLKSFFE